MPLIKQNELETIMIEKPFSYIRTLTHVQERLENVKKNIIPHLEEGQYTIWPAIDGCTKDLEKFYEENKEIVQNIQLEYNVWSHSRTALAIIYTLVDIFKDARKHNLPSMICFEDDIGLYPNFYEKLDRLVKELPEDADFLKFHFHFLPKTEYWDRENHVIPFSHDLSNKTWGSTALYFTQKGIDTVFKALLNAKLDLDCFIHYGNIANDFKGYETKDVNCLCYRVWMDSMNHKDKVDTKELCISEKLPYEIEK